MLVSIHRLLFFLLLWPCCLLGQDITISTLTTADGLSNGMIFDLFKDKDGFMWFATQNGLNRYDGYDFKVYRNDPFDSTSVSGNVIVAILEDTKERFWVLTESNGLNYFDRAKETFYRLKINGGDGKFLDARRNYSQGKILEDRHGNIWIQQKTRLLKLEITDFEQAIHRGFNAKIFPLEGRLIKLNHNGTLMASFPNNNDEIGVQRWDEPTQAFKPFSTAVTFPKNGRLHNIPTDNSLFWLINKLNFYKIEDKGIDHFDLTHLTKSLTHRNLNVRTFRYNPILQKYMLSFGANSAQYYAINLEVASEKVELLPIFSWDKKAKHVRHYWEDESTYWVGTNGYGIKKISIQPKVFRHLMSNKSIARIFKINEEQFLTRSYENFSLLDQASGSFSGLRQQQKIPPFSLGIIKAKNKGYWIIRNYWTQPKSTRGVLVKLDENFGEEKRYGILIKPFLQEDAKGNIWVTTNNKGRDFAFVDVDADSLTYIDCGQFGQSLPTGNVQSLYLDGQNNVWKGLSNGLLKLTLDENGQPTDCQLYQNDPVDRASLRYNSVDACLDDPLDPATYLWVATQGGGLNKLNKKTGKFRHFTTEDGLPDNVVYGILADEENKLWLSTNKGLSHFDPMQETFKNYRGSDGLQDDVFKLSSYYKDEATGALFFGGINGMTTFFPKDLKKLQPNPSSKVYLTELRINNELVQVDKKLKEDTPNPLKQTLHRTKSIDLNWQQNQLSFKFASLDFDVPEKNSHQYRLTPIDKTWVNADKSRLANYSNLAAGDYIFEVRGTNSDGIWNKTPAQLEITIHPPWWKTWWAYLGYALAVVFSIFQIYQFQIKRAKLQNQLLYEQKEAERLAETDRIKTNFFTNITHEFRTPLTLIIEPLRQIIENPTKSVVEKATLAKNNSQKLLGLINQLLDLSKLENQKMPVELSHGNFLELTQSLIVAFRPLAKKSNITLKYTSPRTLQPSEFDKNKVEKVFRNLISNAIKFTPEGGTVSIDLSLIPNSPKQFIFKISDTGIGIAQENQQAIFNRFYQVDGQSTRKGEGTGIGLALCKELVELMDGTIGLDSTLNKGSTFTVQLPFIENQLDTSTEIAETLVTSAIEPTSAVATTILPTSPIINEQNLSLDANNIALIIEDNEELRTFLKASLQDTYQIIEANNGKEGLVLATEYIPNIIVSDVMMPEMDGFEVCQHLKTATKTSHIPIILLTAKTTVDSKIKGLTYGADAYMNKPFHTKELLVRMEKLIELRQVLQAKYSRQIQSNGITSTPITTTETAADLSELSKIDQEFLDSVRETVREHLAEVDFSVEILAKKVFMSRAQLYRKVRALLNISPSDLIRDIRLQEALHLLQTKQGNVTEVAEMVGFSSQKYFSTKFKEKFGLSPKKV